MGVKIAPENVKRDIEGLKLPLSLQQVVSFSFACKQVVRTLLTFFVQAISYTLQLSTLQCMLVIITVYISVAQCLHGSVHT